MRTNRSRVDELKSLISLLAEDILRHLKADDLSNIENMMAKWVQLIQEIRNLHTEEPVKVKDYLNYFQHYEKEMQSLSRDMLQKMKASLSNIEKMSQEMDIEF